MPPLLLAGCLALLGRDAGVQDDTLTLTCKLKSSHCHAPAAAGGCLAPHGRDTKVQEVGQRD